MKNTFTSILRMVLCTAFIGASLAAHAQAENVPMYLEGHPPLEYDIYTNQLVVCQGGPADSVNNLLSVWGELSGDSSVSWRVIANPGGYPATVGTFTGSCTYGSGGYYEDVYYLDAIPTGFSYTPPPAPFQGFDYFTVQLIETNLSNGGVTIMSQFTVQVIVEEPAQPLIVPAFTICAGQEVYLQDACLYGGDQTGSGLGNPQYYDYSEDVPGFRIWQEGGSITSSNSSVAVPYSTYGLGVNTVGPGSTTLTFTVNNACGTSVSNATLNVAGTPALSLATNPMCTGTTELIGTTIGGGTWTSGSPTIGTVDASGNITAIGPGDEEIVYTAPDGCTAEIWPYVEGVYEVQANTTAICAGGETYAYEYDYYATGGGVWSSSDNTVATVAPSGGTGVITGVGGGTANITYTSNNTTDGCGSTFAFTTITVNPAPAAIVIPGVVIAGGPVVTATDATPGGIWSGGAGGYLNIDGSGDITGISYGSDNIYYTLPSTGCSVSDYVQVNAFGTIGNSSPSTVVCGDGPVHIDSLLAVFDISTSATLTWNISGYPNYGTLAGVSGYSTTANGGTVSTSGATYTPNAGFSGSDGFSVQVYDGSNYVYINVTVTVNPAPEPISVSPGLCLGNNTIAYGDGTGNWSGATLGYFTIDGAGDITSVSAGTDNITYTNSSGCYVTASITVESPALVIATSNDISTCGGSDGSITTTLTGATGPYIYSWLGSEDGVGPYFTPPFTAGNASGLSIPGYYFVSVTDLYNCLVSTSTWIYEPDPISVSGTVVSPSACLAGDGSIVLSVTGDVPTDTYLWSNGTTAENPSGLVAGAYSVTVTDANGCFGIANFYLSQPDVFYIGSDFTLPSCYGSTNGSITLNLTDGTGVLPFTYLWSNGATTENLTGLASGTYSVTVTDAHGCSYNDNVSIPQPFQITFGAITTNVSTYGGSDGAIDGESLSGINYPWTWTCSNGTSGNNTDWTWNISGLSAGTYSLTFTDANGCVRTFVYVITQPDAGDTPPSFATGTSIYFNACENSGANAINSLLAISDPDAAQTETWSVISGPAYGTLSGFSATAASGGTGIVPATPVTYTPNTGFVGGDQFTIQVNDGHGGIATAIVYANVTASSGAVSPITGTDAVCQSATTNLADGTTGGVWSSGNPSIATVSGAGVVTGVGGGTAIISYTLEGCSSTAVVTVNAAATINVVFTSNPTICGLQNGTLVLGGLAPLTNYTIQWVEGAGAAGPYGITTDNTGEYSLATGGGESLTNILINSVSGGCPSNTLAGPYTFTNPPVAPITGNTILCIGGVTALSDPNSPYVDYGGEWSYSNAHVAIDGSGHVTGESAGTSIISYSTLTLGTFDVDFSICGTTTVVTVDAVPSAGTINGSLEMCLGYGTSLSDATASGAWSSSDYGIASINTTGQVVSVSGGTAIISYILANCSVAIAQAVVTVNTAPSGTIEGPPNVQVGDEIGLLVPSLDGTWTASNADVTLTPIDGGAEVHVIGVDQGTVTITFATSNSCGSLTQTTTLNVFSSLAINGNSPICIGGEITLTDAAVDGGWSSNNTSVATVDPFSGALSGVAAGTATIKYTLGSQSATTVVTVVTLPAPITGTGIMCVGSGVTLADATPDGSWNSSNYGIASVGSLGIVVGIAPGTATISYSLPGGCSSATVVTVDAVPTIVYTPAAIPSQPDPTLFFTTTGAPTTYNVTWSGPAATYFEPVTGGSLPTSPLELVFSLISAPPDGTYTGHLTVSNGGCSSNPAMTITVNKYTTGLFDPYYTSGCDTCPGPYTLSYANGYEQPLYIYGSAPVSINSLLSASSTNPGSVTDTWTVETPPSDGTLGGFSTLADVTSYTGSTGSGVATPTSLTYIPNAGFAGPDMFTIVVSNGVDVPSTTIVFVDVDTVSAYPILGNTMICIGGTATQLSDAVSGGYWSSSNTAVAFINGTAGTVTGVSAGTAIITYEANDAFSIMQLTVNASVSAGTIAGPSTVTAGSNITLTDATSGGVWSASNSDASVTNGVVTGVSAGSVIISYTVSNGCGTANATKLISVTPPVSGSGDTFYVNGNHIYDPCGNQFVPRGINYSVLDDWSFPDNLAGGGELSTQIRQAHPNIARVAWWINYPDGSRPAYTLADLDSVITRFANDSMLVDLTVMDLTGYASGSNPSNLAADTATFRNTVVDWWTSAPVASLIQRHKKTMLVNIVNEFGYVEYDSNPTEALAIWTTAFTNAIGSMRAAGITVPLIVDGPDYANDISEIATAGPTLVAADPLHNVIMAEHAYWAISSSCDANDTATIRSKLSELNTLSCPVIVEETGNWAPSCDGSEQCGNVVNVNFLLSTCQQYNMGWLYWEWYDDGCSSRQMSNDGTFANLSSIGDTIVYNGTYGLYTNAVKTPFMMNGQSCSGPAPAAINGVTFVCVGATTSLSDGSAGGTWSSGNTTVATVSSGSGIVTGVVAGTATISYTTSGGLATVTVTVTALPVVAGIAGVVSVCQGSTTSLSDGTGGGAWSSNNTSVATVNSSGIVSGISGGAAAISYTVSNGCGTVSATVNVTVNTAPTINVANIVNPTTCGGTNGSVVIGGLTASASYTLYYTENGTPTSGSITASGSGQTSISGLSSTATITNIHLQTSSGCSTNTLAGPYAVTNPSAPTINIANINNPSVCNGNDGSIVVGGLTAGANYTLYYMSNGSAITSPITASGSGQTTITGLSSAVTITNIYLQTLSGCATNTLAGPYSVTNPSLAYLDIYSLTAPTLCNGNNGSIVFGGLTPDSAYTLYYTENGGTVAGTIVASGAGQAGIGLLTAYDTFSHIYFKSDLGCYTDTLFASSKLALNNPSLAAVDIYSLTAPTVCNGNNGSIVFGGLAADSAYTLYYTENGVTNTSTIVASSSGQALLVSLTAYDTFSHIYFKSDLGCYTDTLFASSKLALNNPSLAAVDVYSLTAPTVCNGNNGSIIFGGLAADSAYTLYYTENGVTNGSTIVANGSGQALLVSLTAYDTFSHIYFKSDLGCYTDTLFPSTKLALNNPSLGGIEYDNFVNPTVCDGSNGSIIFGGLMPDSAYTLYYTENGGTIGATIVANSSGQAILGSLNAYDTLSHIYFKTDLGCYTDTLTTSGYSGVVNPVMPAIAGANSVCVGSMITLSDASGGGMWSSSAHATIDGSGDITGVSAGVANVTYSLGAGCTVSAAVTVSALANAGSIAGATSVCTGSAITLSDAAGSGVWSSTNTSAATVSTGGVVTGLASGSTTISYTVTNGCGTVAATSFIVVNPAANAGTISGASSVCAGSSITLNDATGSGVWSSSAGSVATVGSSGLVNGLAAGTATISYTVTNSCGSASATQVVSVNTATAGAITGSSTVNVGASITLADALGGGVWSASNTHATVAAGLVTGVSAGTVTISYMVSGSCGTAYATKLITVNNSTISGISGNTNLCAGTTTTLTDATGGGTWSMSSLVATIVGSTGVVTASGTYTGTASVTYTSGGISTSTVITVYPNPTAIQGATTECAGVTITLSDAATGGVWTGSGDATVSGAGSTATLVAGSVHGTATVTYTLPTGCFVTETNTVKANPTAILGNTTICVGGVAVLSDSTTGGISWSSSNTVVASAAGGDITGMALGVATITYNINTGCSVTTTVNVIAPPGISGNTGSICPYATLALTAGAGTWTSSMPTIATVGATGIVTGVSGGTATISFVPTGESGCFATTVVSISASPAITGTPTLCIGGTTALHDAVMGGTWASGSTGVATIAASGVVTGVSSGTAIITYTAASGCTGALEVTVGGAAAGISGNLKLCNSSTSALNDATTGGSWSISGSLASVVGSTGVVTASATLTGTTTITYSAGGCVSTAIVTVDAKPTPIQGATAECAGLTVFISDAVAGGSWSVTGDATIVFAGDTADLTGGAVGGTATVTYTAPTGCFTTITNTIYANPQPILGNANMCVGLVTDLSDATTPGSWSSSSTAIAIASGPDISGEGAGVATITFKSSAAGTCITTRTVTVSAMPVVTAINGPATISHAGGAVTISDVTAGGVWTSSNAGVIALGGSTGSPVSATALTTTGSSVITYAVTIAGCTTKVTKTIGAATAAHPDGGTATVYAGSAVTLADDMAGGLWSSSDNGIASVDGNGLVTGIMPGNVLISHEVTGDDGAVARSTTNVVVSALPANINILPNPNKGTFSVKGSIGSVADETVTLEVTDMLGQVIYRRNVMAEAGRINETITLSNTLANGMYILNVQSGSGNKTFHFVIEQ